MKIKISKNKLTINPEQILRQVGYGFIVDRRRGQESFVRRLGNYHYPRLHMYIDREGDIIVFSLHLDQKEASYAGAHAHNAEYDGEIVEGEINRLRTLLKEYVVENNKSEGENNIQNTIGRGDYNQVSAQSKNPSTSSGQRKSWWKRIFS